MTLFEVWELQDPSRKFDFKFPLCYLGFLYQLLTIQSHWFTLGTGKVFDNDCRERTDSFSRFCDPLVDLSAVSLKFLKIFKHFKNCFLFRCSDHNFAGAILV